MDTIINLFVTWGRIVFHPIPLLAIFISYFASASNDYLVNLLNRKPIAKSIFSIYHSFLIIFFIYSFANPS